MAMKRQAHLYVIGFVLAGVMAQQSIAGREMKNKTIDSLPGYLIGTYQPVNQVKPIKGANSSIGFFSLTSETTLEELKKFLTESRSEHTIPMISLEPFPTKIQSQKHNQLHTEIVSGRYDDEIESILGLLKREQRPVLVRFAHEMDVKGQYPWCFDSGKPYIDIYRYIHTVAKNLAATNLIWVWSPQGRDNADQYWPGDDQVDIIGISVYASKAFNKNRSLKSFESILSEKKWLGRRFNKPLIAAEVGISGNEVEQEEWLQNALQQLNKRNIKGFFYFQAAQPSFMPLKTGPEDWRLREKGIRLLAKGVKGDQP